jgi:16S rRNA (uracil1498-N3)-methyltransferase
MAYGGTPMQRYFIKDDMMHDEMIKMDPTMHKHLSKVMRKKIGDQVVVINEEGIPFLATITDLDEGFLKKERVLDENNELDVEVTLIYGLPKGDKFEFILQKATELGVKRIVPFLSARSLIKMDDARFNKKKPRYEKIIQEAAEQSHRNFLPTITKPIHIDGMKDYLSEVNVVAYEEEAKQGESHAFKQELNRLTKSITIVVGPEGGFDEEEIKMMNKMGIVSCGLGKRIMRSETAPLYMLSVIGYERELV